MLAFVTSVGVGLSVGILWLLVWGPVLRVPLAFWLARTPEKRALRRQRCLRMGRWRYILLVGILGSGLAFALSLTVTGILDHGAMSWRLIAQLILLSLAFGCVQGSINWDTNVRKEIPFPPHYPSV